MPNALVGQTIDELPLFARLRQPARSGDLDTSHEAARKIQTSGKLGEQCAQTLIALVRYEFRAHESPTSHELAGGDEALRYRYARRLPDLERLGLVDRIDSKRACRVTGANAYPWRVTEEGMRVFRQMKRAPEA